MSPKSALSTASATAGAGLTASSTDCSIIPSTIVERFLRLVVVPGITRVFILSIKQHRPSTARDRLLEGDDRCRKTYARSKQHPYAELRLQRLQRNIAAGSRRRSVERSPSLRHRGRDRSTLRRYDQEQVMIDPFVRRDRRIELEGEGDLRGCYCVTCCNRTITLQDQPPLHHRANSPHSPDRVLARVHAQLRCLSFLKIDPQAGIKPETVRKWKDFAGGLPTRTDTDRNRSSAAV